MAEVDGELPARHVLTAGRAGRRARTALGFNRLPSPPAPPRRYSFTRDQRIEAHRHPELRLLAADPAAVGIPAGAESMADALIEALEAGAHA